MREDGNDHGDGPRHSAAEANMPAGGPPARETEEAARRDGTRVRLARIGLGLSQQELAEAAGVSRQAVAGVEAGRWNPSLRVALALAQALGQRVEELFGPPRRRPALAATLLTEPEGRGQQRVDLAQVGERTVALPLAGDRTFRAGFSPAGGVLVDSPAPQRDSCVVQPAGPLRPTLVVAGCDPALPLLAGPLSMLEQPLGLAWWPCSSREAARLAAAGLVHVAGVHVAEEGVSPADGWERALGHAGLFSGGHAAEVIGFSMWDEGLAFRPGLAVAAVSDVAERHLRFVNREPGSEARSLVEAEMRRRGLAPADVIGFDTAVRGHMLVAAAIAAGLGDVGVTTQPAALAYGLDFVSLAAERSLLVIPRPLLATPEARGLARVLASSALQDQLAVLAGYRGLSTCGEPVASLGG
jgi:molybdate-binding protein/DNA-binding XRE family transcriptional regulator